MLHRIWILSLLALTGCFGPPDAIEGAQLLKELDAHLGKRVVVKAKFRSGARCRQEDGEWKTYCKDCQYCRGPLVIDTGSAVPEEGMDDWPMVLGGTWEGEDIRCKGPLHQIECKPFELGKTYVIQGRLEAAHPPKLLVQKFWKVDS
jgi:hypothetical protein